MELLAFEFIRRAIIVGILLAAVLPCIGMIVVLKRLSLVGDALSHASLVGVTLGILLGMNPVIVSIVVCVIAALLSEVLRKYIPNFKENAIIIILSLSVALSGIFSSKIKSSVNFTSYLFGSIVTVTNTDVFIIAVLTILVLSVFVLLYKKLFLITLDEKNAILSGIPVQKINLIFTIVTAITIAIASKTIGVLIVSSLMVIPILCAMQISKSYFTTIINGIIFSLIFTITGIILSYYLDLRPGGTIALIAVCSYMLLLLKKQ